MKKLLIFLILMALMPSTIHANMPPDPSIHTPDCPTYISKPCKWFQDSSEPDNCGHFKCSFRKELLAVPIFLLMATTGLIAISKKGGKAKKRRVEVGLISFFAILIVALLTLYKGNVRGIATLVIESLLGAMVFVLAVDKFKLVKKLDKIEYGGKKKTRKTTKKKTTRRKR